MYRVETTLRRAINVIGSLKAFQKAFPNVLEERSLVLVQEHLKTNFLNNAHRVAGFIPKESDRETDIQVEMTRA